MEKKSTVSTTCSASSISRPNIKAKEAFFFLNKLFIKFTRHKRKEKKNTILYLLK